jgi:hypothetical protein
MNIRAIAFPKSLRPAGSSLTQNATISIPDAVVDAAIRSYSGQGITLVLLAMPPRASKPRALAAASRRRGGARPRPRPRRAARGYGDFDAADTDAQQRADFHELEADGAARSLRCRNLCAAGRSAAGRRAAHRPSRRTTATETRAQSYPCRAAAFWRDERLAGRGGRR